jgi:hypothetical protein
MLIGIADYVTLALHAGYGRGTQQISVRKRPGPPACQAS